MSAMGPSASDSQLSGMSCSQMIRNKCYNPYWSQKKICFVFTTGTIKATGLRLALCRFLVGPPLFRYFSILSPIPVGPQARVIMILKH